MKIRPVGAGLYHVDGRTDMTELIVAFRNFANEPNMYPIKEDGNVLTPICWHDGIQWPNLVNTVMGRWVSK